MSLINFNTFQHTSRNEPADEENVSVTDAEEHGDKGPRAKKGEPGNTRRKPREAERAAPFNGQQQARAFAPHLTGHSPKYPFQRVHYAEAQDYTGATHYLRGHVILSLLLLFVTYYLRVHVTKND